MRKKDEPERINDMLALDVDEAESAGLNRLFLVDGLIEEEDNDGVMAASDLNIFLCRLALCPSGVGGG